MSSSYEGRCLDVCCLTQLSQQPCWGAPALAPILYKRKQSTEKLSGLPKATQLTQLRQGSTQAYDNFLVWPGHSSLYWGGGVGMC